MNGFSKRFHAPMMLSTLMRSIKTFHEPITTNKTRQDPLVLKRTWIIMDMRWCSLRVNINSRSSIQKGEQGQKPPFTVLRDTAHAQTIYYCRARTSLWLNPCKYLQKRASNYKGVNSEAPYLTICHSDVSSNTAIIGNRRYKCGNGTWSWCGKLWRTSRYANNS